MKYRILDHFLPGAEARRLFHLFGSQPWWSWKRQNQRRPGNFASYRFKNPALPAVDEVYAARFQYNDRLKNSADFKGWFWPLVALTTRRAFDCDLAFDPADVHVYRLLKGDFYRTHLDSAGRDVALTYYLCPDWRVDHGGLLTLVDEKNPNSALTAILPRFNRAVLMEYDAASRGPHFVSRVEDHALWPRYTLVAFGKRLK